jgi:hypothetical protein
MAVFKRLPRLVCFSLPKSQFGQISIALSYKSDRYLRDEECTQIVPHSPFYIIVNLFSALQFSFSLSVILFGLCWPTILLSLVSFSSLSEENKARIALWADLWIREGNILHDNVTTKVMRSTDTSAIVSEGYMRPDLEKEMEEEEMKCLVANVGEKVIGEQADKNAENYDDASHFIDAWRSVRAQ